MASGASVSALPHAPQRRAFLRSERLVVLIGAAALGALLGFAAAIATGRQDIWVMALAALPALAIAAYLTIQTLSEAFAARAWGCATAAIAHIAALMAWPAIVIFAAGAPELYWLAPGLALAALVLLASCWEGPARTIYRTSAQALLVAAVAGQQGVTVLLG